MPDFVNSDYQQPVLEVVLSIGLVNGDDFLVSGTGFIIAPHLAVTAKHVIQDYIQQFANMQLHKAAAGTNMEIILNDFNILAVQYDNERTPHVFRVFQVYVCLQSDIALLYLLPSNEEAKNHNWSTCALNLYPPKIGERIVGFGFHKSSITFLPNQDTKILKWDDQPATTVGQVVEIFPGQRDSSRLNFPCFQTNAQFEGGMSGGPVFNEAGQVCGLICSSLPADNNYPIHISYVALLWPSMITQIKIPYPEFNGKPYIAYLILSR